jgi:dihydrofolate reductase
MNITLIAAMDKNRIIGSNNGMPWHIGQDLAHFRSYTLGKPVVYGRKTLESMGGPFKRRINLVLSESERPVESGLTFCRSKKEALHLAGTAQKQLNSPDIIIAGGGNVYEAFIRLANKLVITHLLTEVVGDVRFPEINSGEWNEINREDVVLDKNSEISFYRSVYERIE